MDTELTSLRANSLPSVRHLDATRNDLRGLRRDLARLAETPETRAERRETIARRRAAMAAHLSAYENTPWYPGEKEAFDARLRPRLEALDAALGRLTAAEDDRSHALGHLALVESEDVDEALAELQGLNHWESSRSAERILDVRVRSLRLEIELDIACSAVALLAAWLAIRASRRFAAITKHNVELLTARADELDTFAQRVAHDLLSPLSTVTFSLDTIARRHADLQTRTAVDRTGRALLRARQMVHGILTFARAGARPAPGARSRLLPVIQAEIEAQIASHAGSAPSIEMEPFEDCEVACDEVPLGVMLSNLLGNASKYTQDATVRRVVVRARVRSDRVRVEIEDTGPGVPPGLEAVIFEPYARAPGVTQPGLGLGLATVKRLAASHGGTVGVQRGAIGALFWFELPRAPARDKLALEAKASERDPAEEAGAPPVH
jgi:signal transduction histidine kinase